MKTFQTRSSKFNVRLVTFDVRLVAVLLFQFFIAAAHAATTVVAWGDNGPGWNQVPAGLTNVVAIADGYGFSLALKADGTVVAWGRYWNGYNYVPMTPPTGLSNVVAVETGGGFALALKGDGTVVAWSHGQLWLGETNVPAGLNNVVAISSGSSHSLALKGDGTLVAWGYYSSETNSVTTGVPVPAGLANVVAIATGGSHALALRGDGSVVAWGNNSVGQLNAPAGLTNVVAIAARSGQSLALKSDGTVVGWGDNYSGQLRVPSDLTNAVAIAAGPNHSLALRRDGTVVGWGRYVVPAGLTNVVAIAAGVEHSLAVIGDGAPVGMTPYFDQTILAGGTIYRRVVATGAHPLSFQWQVNGTNLPSATRSWLLLTNAQLAQTGAYAVAVSNDFGGFTSSISRVDVVPALILVQPKSQFLPTGGSAVFTVEALANAPLGYQWRLNGNLLPGATNSTLQLTNLTPEQAGAYSVTVSNVWGIVTSLEAELRVQVTRTRYVWQGSPNPAPPYTSWDTAAHVFQEALDVAQMWDTVLVTNGVYATGGRVVQGTNRVAVTKLLTVRSVNGPEFTVVDGGHAVRCVYLTNGVTFAGFILTNGVADSGGGVWCESISAIVSNCVLTGNSAGYGGGVSGGTLNNCMLQGNLADSAGGGAYSGTLNNCTLTENSARFQGGGGADYCTLNNCALTGNSAYYGGGASGSELNNCTITGNRATSPNSWGGEGGGAYSCGLNNCIIYFNTARSGENYFGGNLSYCCTTPLPRYSRGNITLDPQLASASHLSAGSPCRGAGSAEYATGADIDGEAWADPPSIGCDEFHAGPATGPLSVSVAASYTNVAVGFTVRFTGNILGQAASNVWDFGDGTIIRSEVFQPLASHNWTSPGEYQVVLRAFNQAHPGGISATVTVQVVTPPVHYVSAASTNPVVPYASWATAARTIQAAVDPFGASTVAGALVLVADGIYATGGSVGGDGEWSRVMVGNPLTLRSLNGPRLTVIDGAGMGRCVYLTSDASLSGFTLTNGFANSGGGLFCESTSATASNCILVKNWAYEGGGAYGGTLHHCLLTANGADGRGGGAYGSTLNHCAVEGNRAEYYSGGGASDSTLNSCILTGNTANNGGGASQSTLNNCTLTGNSAQRSGGGAYLGTLNNCALSGNTGGGASGDFWCIHLDCWDDLVTLNNCTVTGNSGGGVSLATVNNCIVYFNHRAGTAGNYLGATMNYCCTTPLPEYGTGNITNPPLLASASHLSAGSPCRGAGSAAYAIGTDIDGEAWANPPAIGCDEYHPGTTTGPLRVAIQADYTNVEVGFPVNLTGSILGQAVSNSWDFGDGTIFQSQFFQPLASHTWTFPGDYPVVLRAYNEDHPGGISATVTVHVEATPVRQFTTLVAFDESRGLWPNGKLLLDKDGSLYGTTAGGGSGGRGTVFKVTTNGLLTTLVSFAGSNGAEPLGGLVWGLDGKLYGTTRFGGRSDKGTVFKVTTNGMLTMLVAFTGGNGTEPLGGLTLGPDGSLYGTTGGSYDNGYRDGTVFKVTDNGALTTLVRFTGDNGANPEAGLVLDGDGGFYGTTYSGGMGAGTVFRVTTNGVLTTLVSFANENGAHPLARLVWGPGSNLYGTTLLGGRHGSGTVFRMTSNGALSTLVSFSGWDGARPAAELLLGNDGSFYGTTWAGGRHTAVDGEGYGTVFKVTTNGVLTSLVSFRNSNGANPFAGLSLGTDGNFYGTTYAGGPYGGGTIFRFHLSRAPTAVAMVSGVFAISNNATNLMVLSPNSSNASVVLDGSHSLDLDNDQLQFTWYANTHSGLLATGMVAVVRLPVGTNPVQLVVTDGSASSTNVVIVTVLTTSQGVQRIMAQIHGSGLEHPRPLLATLEAALASLERGNLTAAANQLRAFQNQVRAQLSKIDAALADMLLAAAEQMIDALGGGPHRTGGAIRSVKRRANGQVQLQFTGDPGGIHLVQSSTNLLDWETIGVAVDCGGGEFEFQDAQAARFLRRYYRITSQ